MRMDVFLRLSILPALSIICEPGLAAWTEQAILPASEPNGIMCFGDAVCIEGNRVIVGAYADFTVGRFSGAAYVFRYETDWIEEAKIIPADGTHDHNFGHSVSISGDHAIAGAFGDRDKGWFAGAAYIFSCDVEGWRQEAKIYGSQTDDNHYFGKSVSISGDYAIAGSSHGTYIFHRTEAHWHEVGYFPEIIGPVSICGDRAIVGSRDWSSGPAHILKREGAVWLEEATLMSSWSNGSDWFGRAVAITDGYAIVGAEADSERGAQAGAAYVFSRTGSDWVEEARLTAADGDAYDMFGCAVSIAGHYALVGAMGDDYGGGLGDYAGAAYVFKRYANNWVEESKLISSDRTSGDYFGRDVSVSGGFALVGAPSDGSSIEYLGSARVFAVSCPAGDLTGECLVDALDFANFAECWMSRSGDQNWNPSCDISGPPDGVINELDLAALVQDWLH